MGSQAESRSHTEDLVAEGVGAISECRAKIEHYVGVRQIRGQIPALFPTNGAGDKPLFFSESQFPLESGENQTPLKGLQR